MSIIPVIDEGRESHEGASDVETGREAYERARHRLVATLLRDRVIRSRRIAAAFRAVPREAFVPTAPPESVYADTTIPVSGVGGEWLTTSSQPAMMALMLEQLQPRPGDHVLEIGTGTGYNAALLSRLTGPRGRVHTVEIEGEAVHSALRSLRREGCSAEVHHSDGAEGWPDGAPYDRILATVAVWDVPTAWLDQAGQDGRIVAPLTVAGGEYSAALERQEDTWVSRSLEPCAFVRFKGRLSHPDTRLVLGQPDDSVLMLTSEPAQLPSVEEVNRWMQDGTGQSVERFRAWEWDGFVLHLLSRHGPSRLVRAQSPRGLGWQGQAVGLWDEWGMALVTSSGRLERFGSGGSAERLEESLAEWMDAGRPDIRRFRLRLLPGVDVPGPGRLPRWRHTLLVEETGR